MPFLYETHMHTCQASACGRATGKEQARVYKDAGYTGIIMTDHFFGGNTAIDRSLPWEERVDLFWRGYEDAKEEGDRIGLDVFFGLEQNFRFDEYLIYGLTKEYMKAHPEMEHWNRHQQLEEVHKAGGCVIQAHPFRIRGYMDKIRLGLQYSDGIEAANAGNEILDDARAWLYAQEFGLLTTAGSDNHRGTDWPLYGVVLDQRLTDIRDYVKLVLEGKQMDLLIPEGRLVMPDSPEIDERHKAYMLDDSEQEIPTEKEWIC